MINDSDNGEFRDAEGETLKILKHISLSVLVGAKEDTLVESRVGPLRKVKEKWSNHRRAQHGNDCQEEEGSPEVTYRCVADRLKK